MIEKYPTLKDFGEDLKFNNELGTHLAAEYCTDQCQDYHLKWIRRRVDEGDKSSPLITTPLLLSQFATGLLMRDFCAGTPINILICGSADTKLLALVDFVLLSYGIYDHHYVSITVTDACMTPLKLCEAFADGKRFKLILIHGLMPESIKGLNVDIALMSGVLQFIEKTAQIRTLENIRENITGEGFLVFSHSYKRIAKARDNANYGFSSVDEIKSLLHNCGLKLISEADAEFTLPFGQEGRKLRSRFAAVLSS